MLHGFLNYLLSNYKQFKGISVARNTFIFIYKSNVMNIQN